MTSPHGNFGFLAAHAPLLADLGATAERLFPFDPASCVLKLRLLAEAETGGYGQSGLGRLHGPEGLNDFLETKHIYMEQGLV